jgi:hypothetical protein
MVIGNITIYIKLKIMQLLMKSGFVLFVTLVTFYVANGQNVITSASVDYEGVKKLEVEGAFCKVVVKGGATSKVSFKGEISGDAKKTDYEIKYSFADNKMKVWLEKPTMSIGNVRGVLEFTVPSSVILDITNSSGSVEVSNIKSKTIKLTTSSGSISAEEIESEGTLTSSSGSIKLNEMIGAFTLKSSSGSQKLNNVKGNIKSTLSSGSLHVKRMEGELICNASSGSLNFTDFSGKVNASASSGSIKGENVLLKEDGKFSTSSGSITVQFQNDLSEFSYDLSASSGSLTVGNNKFKKNYVAQRGPIKIKGTSSSGSQRYL